MKGLGLVVFNRAAPISNLREGIDPNRFIDRAKPVLDLVIEVKFLFELHYPYRDEIQLIIPPIDFAVDVVVDQLRADLGHRRTVGAG